MSSVDVIEDQLTLLRNHKPRNVVRDGRLYCDGIEVFKEQLTADELKEFFPEDYAKEYGEGLLCPYCTASVDTNDKRSIVSHLRKQHMAEYLDNKDAITAVPTPKEVLAALKAIIQNAAPKEEDEG